MLVAKLKSLNSQARATTAWETKNEAGKKYECKQKLTVWRLLKFLEALEGVAFVSCGGPFEL